MAPASNKRPRGHCITEENGKKKAKPVGWDKGSLTEQQSKQTVTNNNTDKKNIQNKQQNTQSSSHHLMPRTLLSCDSLCPGQLLHAEPSMMARGIEHPICFATLGQLAQLHAPLASFKN